MLIKRRRGWELGENQATPEGCYLKRRELVRAMGLGAAASEPGTLSIIRHVYPDKGTRADALCSLRSIAVGRSGV